MYPRERVDLPRVTAEYLESQHLMFQELRHFKRIATPIPEQRIRNARAGCRVGGGAPQGWPPSAAQTARTVFP